uniref:Uncharacterized protein n=1 Tax=Anopheles minimus TaxID=112268 RepID=A0A182WN62_9DIPT
MHHLHQLLHPRANLIDGKRFSEDFLRR